MTLHDSFDGTALIRAAERGHWQIVDRLLQPDLRQRSQPDHVNNLGWTALLEAVVLGDGSARYVETVRLLLAAGADPTITGRDGLTALEHARNRGHGDIVRALGG